VLAYWPVSFFVYSLKNDALNYFLPVRYHVSEAISNGEWPFWSPYINLGYPLHGDMQSGAWNPIVQLFSLFGPYTLRTLHYETLLYVFLSGLGMFYLLKYFIIDKRICLLIAVSYMLCGYNSDSAQFLNWISSASFLPFVILFSLRSVNENLLQFPIYCGFFIYLFFVTAYPADFIILFYLLAILFIWHLFQDKREIKKKLPLLLKKTILIAIVFIILSLPAILSYFQSLPLTERGSGATYEEAMSNPLHPGLLFSYITPLPVWKAPFAGITDPLERNSYFGLITFAFLIVGFFFKTTDRWMRFCKWAFIITLVFSLGEIGGIRPLSYYVLPLMNSFRHPANAKIFTIFFGCIIGAFSMHQISFSPGRKYLTYTSGILFIITVLLAVWCLSGNFTLFNETFFTANNGGSNKLKTIIDHATFSDLLLLDIVIQIPFLAILYFFSIKKTGFKILLYSGLLNSIIHTCLFMPFTVVKKDKAVYIQSLINKEKQKNFPAPDLNASILDNSKEDDKLFKEIGSSNLYNKKIGRIEYRITPSNLNNQNLFWNTNHSLRNLLLTYPILYKADTILLLKDSAKVYSLRDSKAVVLNEINSHVKYNKGNYKVTVKSFTPNKWDLNISGNTPGFYCLFQNFYPNWKLYVDGKETQIFQCNVSFMGFTLNEGTHNVSLRYEPIAIKAAFFISLISLFSIFIIILKKPNSAL
jgi:hypothetical protein